MNEFLILASPWIGGIGAVLTTVCWLPQAVQVLRDRDTTAISLTTSLTFSIGLIFWLLYGIATTNWPLIGSEIITIALSSVILAMKLRHG